MLKSEFLFKRNKEKSLVLVLQVAHTAWNRHKQQFLNEVCSASSREDGPTLRIQVVSDSSKTTAAWRRSRERVSTVS